MEEEKNSFEKYMKLYRRFLMDRWQRMDKLRLWQETGDGPVW